MGCLELLLFFQSRVVISVSEVCFTRSLVWLSLLIIRVYVCVGAFDDWRSAIISASSQNLTPGSASYHDPLCPLFRYP